MNLRWCWNGKMYTFILGPKYAWTPKPGQGLNLALFFTFCQLNGYIDEHIIDRQTTLTAISLANKLY